MTFTDELVAKAAAYSADVKPLAYPKFLAWKIAKITTLSVAALSVDGWLSIALWVIAVVAFLPIPMLGFGVLITAEKRARLDAIDPWAHAIVTSKTRCYSKAAS